MPPQLAQKNLLTLIWQLHDFTIQLIQIAMTNFVRVFVELHHIALDALLVRHVECPEIRVFPLKRMQPFVLEIDGVDEKHERRRIQGFVQEARDLVVCLFFDPIVDFCLWGNVMK